MSYRFRLSFIMILQSACVAILLAGCEEVMKQMPSGTDRMIQSGMSIGSDPVSHYYLGKIALDTGSPDQAIAHLTSALKGEVEPVEAYRELGLVYYKKKDRAKAIESFERYLEVAPNANDADRIRKSSEDLKRS